LYQTKIEFKYIIYTF